MQNKVEYKCLSEKDKKELKEWRKKQGVIEKSLASKSKKPRKNWKNM